MMSVACVVMGASNGGLAAFSNVLSQLQPGLPVPVILVLHVRENSSGGYLDVLSAACCLEVIMARDKLQLRPGVVYVARPGYHLLINNRFQLGLSIDAPVNYSRPSIDLLFETAAKCFGHQLLAVLLTGDNEDGSRGLQLVHERGGQTLVQDPEEAESPDMPAHAIGHGYADRVCTLTEISARLNRLGTDTESTAEYGAGSDE